MAVTMPIQKMSNLDYFYLAEELQPLVGGFVNKIYELRPNVFRFKIRADKDNNLVFELGLRAHLSKYAEESPETPTNFAMLLRKYLENAKIIEIKQENDDRLLVFTLEKKEEYHVIFEMFAKGNLILATADYTIIAPYKSESTEKRIIKKMETYMALPNANRLAEKPPKNPTVYYVENKPVGFSCIGKGQFPDSEAKSYLSISTMADEYYFSALQQKGQEGGEAKTDGTEEVRKLEFTLKQQQTALKKFEQEVQTNQEAGNYVYQNFEQIGSMIKMANELLNGGAKEKDAAKEISQKFNVKAQITAGKLTLEMQ